MLSQGFSQPGLGSGLPAGRASAQHQQLLLSQQLGSQPPLASQGLGSRPMSSGSTFCAGSQPALSGVFRPNTAPSQLSSLPGASNSSPWQQQKTAHLTLRPLGHDAAGCADPPALQLGLGRATGTRPLFQKKQLSVLGKPSSSSSGPQMPWPSTAPGLGGPSSRFAAAATQGGFQATGSHRLLPLESQDEDANLLSQPGSQQHQVQQQQQHQHHHRHHQPGSQSLLTQGSRGMDWDNSGNRPAPMTRTGPCSMLAAGSAGPQQRLGTSTANMEDTQMTADPSQQHPQHEETPSAAPAASKAPGNSMERSPVSAECKQTAAPEGAMQTPKADTNAPVHGPAHHSTPAQADTAPNLEQQQLLLSRITTLEEHCCSVRDIVNNDIPQLLQQQAQSSKQLQELTAAAASNSSTNSTLQTQLQNLTSSVASFMTEFKHWQEQHAVQSSTVLSHAECQTTPGLAAAAAPSPADNTQPSAGSDAGAAAADSAKPSGSGRTTSMTKQTPSGQQQQQQKRSSKSASLMDLLFSQPQPSAAAQVSAGPSDLPAKEEDRAVLSPSGARFQGGNAAAGAPATSSKRKDSHSPFAVSMLAVVPAAPAGQSVRDGKGTPAAAEPAAAAAAPVTKLAAKRRAAGGGCKGRGKAAASIAAEEGQAGSPTAETAAAAAAGRNRQRSAKATTANAASGPRRQSGRCSQKAQQQNGCADGLTQSKLSFQRTTRAVVAAAAALGVSLDRSPSPSDTPMAGEPTTADEAAAAATEQTDAAPSPKRHRPSSSVAGCQSAGIQEAAAVAGQDAGGRWLLDGPQQRQQQQQQPVVCFSRQNRQSRQAAAPGQAAPTPAVPGAPPAGLPKHSTSVIAAVSGAGRQADRRTSLTAAGSAGGVGSKRDRPGQVLGAAARGATGAAAAGAAGAAALHAGGLQGSAAAAGVIAGRRASASAAAGAHRRSAAATSSAMMLFGDVEDSGDSLVRGGLTGRACVASSATRTAGDSKGQTGGAVGRAAGVSAPPAAAAGVFRPVGGAAGLPPLAPHVAAPAAPACEFGKDTDEEDGSDTEHSLDQLPAQLSTQQQQQQQQRLIDQDELAREIAARMARHRSKQRRTLGAWGSQGG